MASRISYLVALSSWIAVLWLGLDYADRWTQAPVAIPTKDLAWASFFSTDVLPRLPVANEFDTPLRPPDGTGAVITLPFLEGGHLGEDWATAKGDASLGEPVYSVADGWVSVAQNFGTAWGMVVFVCYRMPKGDSSSSVEVMYAQLKDIEVKAGEFVKRGQKIGTVGNAKGTYSVANGYGAHLHWEVRQAVGKGIGAGFDANHDGWIEPCVFLKDHRGARMMVSLKMLVLPKSHRANWGTDY
jgi:murein DD-endopeptidase MepM/ murein hydrolase activator NlpD